MTSGQNSRGSVSQSRPGLLRIAAGLLLAALAGTTCSAGEPSSQQLAEFHTREAAAYQMCVDEAHQKALTLRTQPISSWTNVAGQHPQHGHLYVWLDAGRPAIIGTIFSVREPDATKRKVIHEFHTLSTAKLHPVTPAGTEFRWQPQRGIDLPPLADAPAVGASAIQRTQQMKTIARSFSAETLASDGARYQLRLQTTPLFVYEPSSGEALHGALFSMVGSTGTDPEAVLLIEARRPASPASAPAANWVWHGAAVRFSDRDVTVARNGKTLWSSLTEPNLKVAIKHDYRLIETPDKRYMCYQARIVPELPEPPAKPAP